MAALIDRLPRNLNDTATISEDFNLNSTTTVKVADANGDRLFFEFHNMSNRAVRLKLYAQSVDNDNSKGIPVARGETWRMEPGQIYTGEISAISVTGATVAVMYIEY